LSRLRRRAIPLGLVAFAYALALWQRPGDATSDTKIDLHVDPGGFLRDVASVWTSTGSLGHLQGGQYGGYLWPMGPFFALFHALGLAPWLVQRLWLGTVLALLAYGVVRLMDDLLERDRGAAHLAAGAIALLNPYVVVFFNRTSITLLAYAALPWLLLAVHRGVRREGGWVWPAAFALVLTSSGGGVNAGVLAWVLLAPLLLLLYEPVLGGATWKAARGFAWRTVVTAGVASAWWVVPLLVQTRYGIDFLRFTEQPGTIWGTTSSTESLRLMGYWVSYIGVGFSGRPLPYFDDSHTLLFSAPVLVASLVVPGLALAGFAWTRRWRYGPLFLALVLVGLVVMIAGFPEGTPLRRALTAGYFRVDAVQFLRTTYKAGPLVALGIACLGGAAAGEAWRRLRSRPPLAYAGAAVFAVLLAVSAWPAIAGRGIDERVTWDRIPPAWTQAGAGLDDELPANGRAMVLPGQLFSFYRWGGTIDPILPVVTERPVAVRQIVPYADLHAIDLQWTVDTLVQQRRAYPGQLAPLLSLLGVRSVVTGTDDDRTRSGALQPAEAARVLGTGQGLGPPARSYGPTSRFAPEPGKPGAPVALPQVRRYDLRGSRGLVRVEPLRPQTIVDGSAWTLAGMAAFGALPQRTPLFYAADRSAAEIRSAASQGAEVVVGDGNRRRVFVASRLAQNVGWTLDADDELSPDAALLDPFDTEGRGTDAQTVQVLDGARYVRAPFSPGFSQFPEHRPYAAFDGDPRTAWLADPSLEERRRYVEIGFDAPRNVPFVVVTPYADARGATTAVEIAGRTYPLKPGRNRLPVGLTRVDSLRIRIAGTRKDDDAKGVGGGLFDVTIPGAQVTEVLRPPLIAEQALRGADLERTGLSYLFERTTGDDPFRHGTATGPAQARQVRDAGDGERAMARLVTPPAARDYGADAWVTIDPQAPDSNVDALVGADSEDRFDSSGRWLGLPRYRASRAFDGSETGGWIGGYIPGRPTWLQWRTPDRVAVRDLLLTPGTEEVATPARVRVVADGVASPPVEVGRDGAVLLPRALRGRTFRLDILAVRAPKGYGPGKRRAVGIGEVRGRGVPRSTAPRAGAVRTGCDALRVLSPGGALGLRVTTTVAAVENGTPLRATGCGTLPLGAGEQLVRVAPGFFLADLVRLRSAAPLGLPAPSGGGRVVDPGKQGRGTRKDVRVALTGASWLVLAESYNEGWRATCDGKDLGAPRVIDGFANGWRAPPGCREVDFAFAPNRWVWAGYAASAVAILVLLGLVLAAALRARRERRAAPAATTPARAAPLPDPHAVAFGPVRAGLVALAAAVPLALAFSLRSGPLIAIGIFVILWRGIGARALALAAGALLVVVVPLLYVLRPLHDHHGYNFGYAVDRLGAHDVGVAALLLLALALVRTVAGALRGRSAA
jgi:arabinofuranan 3-O-arabinosyltransferase